MHGKCKWLYLRGQLGRCGFDATWRPFGSKVEVWVENRCKSELSRVFLNSQVMSNGTARNGAESSERMLRDVYDMNRYCSYDW